MLATSHVLFGVLWAMVEAVFDGTPAFRHSWARGVLIFATIYLIGRLVLRVLVQ